MLVGLALWNVRLVEGFALDVPPNESPIQRLRNPTLDDRVPEHWPRDPVLRRTLDELDWVVMLAKRPGWTWETARDATLHVELELGPPEPIGPVLFAKDAAGRQRRRMSWDQNLARYELPPGSKVHVNVAASPALRRMLGNTSTRDSCVRNCG